MDSDSKIYFDKYGYHLNKSELVELVENAFPYDYQDFLTKHLTPKFEIIEIRGYSQGDYAQVIFTHKDINEYSFEDREQFLSMMRDYFTNLFYSSPLYIQLQVDGEEYQLGYELRDEYEYNKGEVLKVADSMIEHDEKSLIIKWLTDNLPEQPEYK